MKIAIIIAHFDPLRGTAEHFAVWLADQLNQKGHEVHVVCHDARRRTDAFRAAHQGASHDAVASAESHQRHPPVFPAGLHIHRLKAMRLNTAMGMRIFGQQARAWCRRNKPDIAHSLSVAWAGDIYHPEAGVYAEMHSQIEKLSTRNGDSEMRQFFQRFLPRDEKFLLLEKKAVRPRPVGGPWKIICVSPMVAQQFRAHYQLPASSLVQLYNPHMNGYFNAARAARLRQDFRAHFQLQAADRVALFVGHDFQRKGLNWAIDAVLQATGQWRLLVVGQGKVRHFQEAIEARNLTRRIIFVGPTRQMNQIYCAADALIFPAIYNAFGQVALEALAHGLPVITTRHCGCAPLIDKNNVGAVVDSANDVSAMAHALNHLPRDSKTSDQLAARARTVAAHFDAASYVEKIEQLYAEYGLALQRNSTVR